LILTVAIGVTAWSIQNIPHNFQSESAIASPAEAFPTIGKPSTEGPVAIHLVPPMPEEAIGQQTAMAVDAEKTAVEEQPINCTDREMPTKATQAVEQNTTESKTGVLHSLNDRIHKLWLRRSKEQDGISHGEAKAASRGMSLVVDVMKAQVDSLEVRGVQVGAYSARAMINNHVIQQGERIACGKKHHLIFRGVQEGNMVFEDEAGNVYRRDLHRIVQP
jgi:hypothetical protein